MNHSEEFKFWVPFYFKKGPLLVPSLLKIGSPWDCGTLNSELKKNTLYDQICPDVARNTVFHLTGDPLKFTCMEKTLLPHGSPWGPFQFLGPHFCSKVPIFLFRAQERAKSPCSQYLLDLDEFSKNFQTASEPPQALVSENNLVLFFWKILRGRCKIKKGKKN